MLNVRYCVCAAALCALMHGIADTTYTEKVNGIVWRYYIVDGNAYVGDNKTYANGATGVAISTSTEGAISIPPTLGGYPVAGVGHHAFNSCRKLTKVTIPTGVVSIGYAAFNACQSLGSVTIPSGVVDIGESAFSLCIKLKSVTIPASVTNIGNQAFMGCESLASVNMSYGVMIIGNHAFDSCSSLKSIVIPDSVTSIGSYALGHCTKITSVTIPSKTMNIGFGAFYGCNGLTRATILDGVESIGSYAFYKCDGLTCMTIPASVTSIGSKSFYGCSNLREIVFKGDAPSCDGEFEMVNADCTAYVAHLSTGWGVEMPGKWKGIRIEEMDYITDGGVDFNIKNGVLVSVALNGAEHVAIPNSVSNIGSYALAYCSNLVSILLPKSLKSIEGGAFLGCSGLKHMSLPFVGSKRGNSGMTDSVFGYIFGSNSYIGGQKITQCYDGPENSPSVSYYIPASLKSVTITDESVLGYGAFYGCSGLTNIVINSSVTKVGGYSFRNCTGITSLAIPTMLKDIECGTFRGAANLNTVIIPHGVTNIGVLAFGDCDGLTSIVMPDSVTSIEASAFSGCSGLSSVTIHNTVTSIGEEAFYNCNGLNSVRIADLAAWCKISFKSENSNPLTYAHNLYLNDELVTNLIIPDGVTSIGNRAFQECHSITNVTMSHSIKGIGEYAFNGCVGLNDVVVPSNVTDIGKGCFTRCTNLVSVTLPFIGSCRGSDGDKTSIFGHLFGQVMHDGLTKIVQAYTYKSNNTTESRYIPARLKSVTITDETIVPKGAFDNCCTIEQIILNEGITKICEHAFAHCTGLKDLTIPQSVISMGQGALCDCASLTTLTLPFVGSRRGDSGTSDSLFGYIFGTSSYTGGVTTKQYYSPSTYSTYYIPSSLNSVTITDESELGYGAFYGCSGLTNITIVDSVVKVGDNAFEGCSGLESVNLPNGLNDLGRNDFRSANLGSGLCVQSDWVLGYIGEAPVEVVVPEGVMGIASYAFEGQTGLERVRLPSTLKYIGVNAFMGCTALEEVEIPDVVEKIDDGAFKNCTWLQDLKLPQQLTIIGKESFANCAMLPNLVCEEGLATIGEQAFSNCWRMLSVSLPVSLTSVGANAFVDCKRITGVMSPTHIHPFSTLFPSAYTNIDTVVVPDGEWMLTANAFKGCRALVDIAIPSTVTQVCASVFQDCTALAAITLPNDIEALGASAFQGCSALENVRLPRSLKTIGNSAFRSCPALGELALPNSVQAIGDYAFCDDARLENITLPNALKSVGAYAFSGCSKVTAASYASGVQSIGAYAYQNCSSVRNVYIPSSVTSLGASIFYNCAAITNITTVTAYRTMASLFPEVYNKLAQITIAPGETKICANCFANCAALTEIGIPDSVTTIGASAFSGCTKLARVSLSSQLEALPNYAFKNCSSLATLTIPESVASLGKNVFEGCSKLESLYFVGNAPAYDAAVFSGIASGVTVFVVNGSMGWDGVATSRALPDSWPTSNSREITYWEPNRFNVVFDANGGLPESSVIEQITGMTYSLPKVAPTRSGATFLGWWTEPVNGAQVTAGTQVTLTRAHTFYAHWAGNLYRVAFEANGGMGEMPEQTCMVGEASELPLNVFARPGFVFVGWATEPEGALVYGDGASVVDLTLESDATVVLYAVWDEKAWATGDYLNVPGRLFTMGGDADWVNEIAVCHDGVGSMRSGRIGLDSESSMSTTVVGEGDVSFWWKVSCEETYKGERYDYVAFFVDGVEKGWMAGETDWTNATFEVVGSGVHTLTWIYHKDDWDELDYDGDDCAWVDEFVWEPAAVTVTFDGNGNTAGAAPKDVVKYEGYSLTMPGAGTLERFSYVFGGWSDGKNVYAPGAIYVFTGEDVEFSAVWTEKIWTYADFLNCTNMLFTTSVGTEWFGDFSTNHDWVVSARSAAIEDGGLSWIQGVVSSAGTLSFWAKVSGEEKRGRMYDYLNVTVDGETVYSAANVDWTNVIVNITLSGTHTVRWTYMKDSSNSVGYDCAWLDEVMWTPSMAGEAIPRITEDAAPEAVTNAIKAAGFADEAGVKVAIGGSAAEYAAFKVWAGSVKGAGSASGAVAGEAAVVANTNAAAAYLLGATRLFENAPKVEFGEVSVADDEGSGALGITRPTMTVMVTVKDGEEAVKCAAEKVKEMFEATSDLGDWNGAAKMSPTVTVEESEGATMQFKVTPGDGTATRAFLRIRK